MPRAGFVRRIGVRPGSGAAGRHPRRSWKPDKCTTHGKLFTASMPRCRNAGLPEATDQQVVPLQFPRVVLLCSASRPAS
jgi:hypothetical protein